MWLHGCTVDPSVVVCMQTRRTALVKQSICVPVQIRVRVADDLLTSRSDGQHVGRGVGRVCL